jgi:hypothetical protein
VSYTCAIKCGAEVGCEIHANEASLPLSPYWTLNNFAFQPVLDQIYGSAQETQVFYSNAGPDFLRYVKTLKTSCLARPGGGEVTLWLQPTEEGGIGALRVVKIERFDCCAEISCRPHGKGRLTMPDELSTRLSTTYSLTRTVEIVLN